MISQGLYQSDVFIFQKLFPLLFCFFILDTTQSTTFFCSFSINSLALLIHFSLIKLIKSCIFLLLSPTSKFAIKELIPK